MASSHASSSSSLGASMDGSSMWVKLKRCSCRPNAFFEVKISTSTAYPNRLFYNCRFCGKFGWVEEEDLKRDDADMGGGGQMADGFAALNAKLGELVKFIDMAIKMSLFMYLVIVLLVMLKVDWFLEL